MTQETQQITINGVDVPRLKEILRDVRADPGLGKFEFRVRNRWLGIGQTRSEIRDFTGARQEHRTDQEPFVVDSDEPEIALGEDHAPCPVEYVLHALAACLTTTIVYQAAARGIQVESVEAELSGEMDVRGFWDLSKDVRNGYQKIRARFRVKSDAPAEALRALAQRSAVLDTIANPVPVDVTVEKV